MVLGPLLDPGAGDGEFEQVGVGFVHFGVDAAGVGLEDEAYVARVDGAVDEL